MKVAPKIVSGRVVNTRRDSGESTIGKSMKAPSDFPIQFSCWTLIREVAS